MSDFVYVNILNEGKLPWLHQVGPVFGYRIALGVFQILKRDPNLKIEITTPSAARIAREKYLKEKKKKTEEAKANETVNENSSLNESIETRDEIQVTAVSLSNEEKVEEDTSDSEIDAILAESDEEPSVFENAAMETLSTEVKTIANTYSSRAADVSKIDGSKTFSEEELDSYTKRQLKKILSDRGETFKYHDSIEDLRNKVRRSQ